MELDGYPVKNGTDYEWIFNNPVYKLTETIVRNIHDKLINKRRSDAQDRRVKWYDSIPEDIKYSDEDVLIRHCSMCYKTECWRLNEDDEWNYAPDHCDCGSYYR